MTQQFKRNQVEGAIGRTLDPKSVRPSTEMRSCIKRLLDADRVLPSTSDRAFSSGGSPGTGNANSFSILDAFMLLLGVRLNMHFWPQKTVVELLRRARLKLEHELKNILALDPAWLFDPKEIAKVPESSMVAHSARPMFFVVATDGNSRAAIEDLMFRIDEPRSAYRFCMEKAGRSSTWVDLVTPAHELRSHLLRIEPAKRGRS